MFGPSILFCPADRSDRYQKALAAADSVIIDLEDAVAPADKVAAREQLIASSAAAGAYAGPGALDPARVIVRVNPVGTDDHDLDIAAVLSTQYRTIMLAKAEAASQFDALGDAGLSVIALCETVVGVERSPEIAAHPAVIGTMWGAEDLAASLGGRSSRHDDGRYRDFARYARSRVLFAAKAAGKMAIDSVYVNIPDLDGLRAEAADAAASGFNATASIHPSQMVVIREAYAPSAAERDWAERVLDEATRQPGVFRFEGKMVDEPVLRQARTMLGR
ncbi:MAG: CoA ester lyase [Leucobacter sp.]|nr:CoA ester lyase [Leucobacter sp.]